MLLAAVALLVSLAAAPARAQSGPVITTVAAIGQNGCPFCCEFSCRGTPTPTPIFDTLGRPVLQRPSGRFLFVVEAAQGLSGRSPSIAGTSRNGTISPLLASGLPGIQMLVGRPLGNGSSAVECGTPFAGGVPAVPALDFGTQASTKNAMVDVACRYEWTQAGAPCTRDRFGGFAALNSATTLQYCLQVPFAAEFPSGETTVSLRLADATGAVGPTRQVVIRVGTAPPTPPAPTPTPTPISRLLSGEVVVAANGRALPAVQMLVNGATGAVTDSAGAYSLSATHGTTSMLRPRKLGGVGDAVSPLDAAYALQFSAGLRTLSPLLRLACDVTGNGGVGTLDASLILRRVVGLDASFPVNGLCQSDWGFAPVPAAAPNQLVIQPLFSGQTCQSGEIRYQPLAANAADQDFLAFAHGDCTGNWSASGAAAAALHGAAVPRIRLGRARHGSRGRVKIPVYIDADPFYGVELEVDYAASAWRPRPPRQLAALAAALLQANDDGGTQRIAVAAARPIATEQRPAFVLVFDPHSRRRRNVAPIIAVRATVDEVAAVVVD